MNDMPKHIEQTIQKAFGLEGFVCGNHRRFDDKGDVISGEYSLQYIWSITYRNLIHTFFTISVAQGYVIPANQTLANFVIPPPEWNAHLIVYRIRDNSEFANSNPFKVVKLDDDPIFEILQSMPLLPAGSAVQYGGFTPRFTLFTLTHKAKVTYKYDGPFEDTVLSNLWDSVLKFTKKIRSMYQDEQIENEFEKIDRLIW